MQLTKFSHSCVRLADSGRSIVIDPGGYSEVEEALDGTSAVLITHEHPDHLDAERLRAAAARDSGLRIWAPSVVARSLADLGDRVSEVAPNQTIDVAGFQITTVGGQHALIHTAIPTVANVGYLIHGAGGAIYHPGDSLFVPPVEVDTLLVPVHAPWSKIAEVIDFIVSVRAPRVHQIHDALLNADGIGLVEALVNRLTASYGVTYTHLGVRETVER